MWRTLVRPLFDVRPIGSDLSSFSGGADILHAGTVLLSRTAATAQCFHREIPKYSTPEWDHIVVQLYETGGYVGDCAGESIGIEAGEISVLDLGRPFETTATDFSNVTLLIPREVCARAQGGLFHGRRLGHDSVMTPLVRSHMTFLADNAPRLTGAEMGAGVEALLTLMNASAGRDGDARARAALAASLRQKIVQFIDERLADSELSPAAIASGCGLSRASLYRLAEVDDGIAALVQSRRLSRAFDLIVDASARAARIDDICHSVGFASAAHFSRAFKACYGVSPRDLRALASQRVDCSFLKRDRRLADWTLSMRQLYERLLAQGG
ncbi:helix-turn-helix domain-containing protein [Jiella pacifica]|uniref:Helix-turn-helix domain-containing protein n=1 Tax=Jiella pacifica TaxID=2696469 RepID=A0A6N9SVP4_9HYPH|nr:helix-turn-helix domain-containing protein [Jiella pacifica]NDW02871.1 helix-turn-helix domain-containing protein [Jiella pacifica]